MAQGGTKGIRAKFADAKDQLVGAARLPDPLPGHPDWKYDAGAWMGAPADNMPPNCPVVPLGKDGPVYFFFDSMRQVNVVKRAEWNQKTLLDLFCANPNYVYHHWPRFSEKKAGKPSFINGLETNEAVQCLMKACADAGIFSLRDRVRGRGMWLTGSGRLVWHSGDGLWTIERGNKLVVAPPGVIEADGKVYPGRSRILLPWQEPVDPSDTPVHEILKTLRSWNWERPVLDPILIIGWIGCAFLGPALPWRPTLFMAGDARVGKSTLQGLIRALFGEGLIEAAETTAAGIYQEVGTDGIPVSVDELEAEAENGRATSIVKLARLAASGDVMRRGGADHQATSFTLRNTFAFSAINPPAMSTADRQRMIFVNMHRLKETKAAGDLSIGPEDGRMILRAVMDAWPKFDVCWKYWREALKAAGFEDRGTYSVSLAVAHLLLGDEAMEEAGLPVTEAGNSIGQLVAAATAEERAGAGENWSDCILRILGFMIDAWKSGERVTVGGALDAWEHGSADSVTLRSQLALCGLGFTEKLIRNEKIDVVEKRVFLAVPVQRSPLLDKVFAGSTWASGVWAHALKQAPPEVVIRDQGNGQNVKINRAATRCLLVDMRRFDEAIGGE